jgi:hypothetical protein
MNCNGLELQRLGTTTAWNYNGLELLQHPADRSERIQASQWPSTLHAQVDIAPLLLRARDRAWLWFFVDAGPAAMRHSHIDAGPAPSKNECWLYRDP